MLNVWPKMPTCCITNYSHACSIASTASSARGELFLLDVACLSVCDGHTMVRSAKTAEPVETSFGEVEVDLCGPRNHCIS